MRITLAPLSSPECLTRETTEAISGAKFLFLQTERHPFAKFVTENHTFQSMDDLYENAEDYEELDASIVKRLMDCGSDCVYATTGDVSHFVPILREKLERQGGDLVQLRSVSVSGILFPKDSPDICIAARDLHAPVDPYMGLVITEIDNQIIASDIKLLLSEFYPDEWKIRLAHIEDDCSVTEKSIALCELDREKRFDAMTGIFVPPCTFEALERFGLRDLEYVMKLLRAPNGCPWDKEQTHDSIKKDLIEEAYEVIDAIDHRDDGAMTEELGDVLMQVVFHSEIAREQSRFTLRDVTTDIVSKLVYRHPHVFSDVKVDGSADVLRNWDALKQKEKHQTSVTDTLKAVPNAFPALMRAYKIQKRAAKVGFDWPTAEEAFAKIPEETEELRNAMHDNTNIREELGDLLFSVVNVSRLLGIDPEEALRDAADKFVSRFALMEQLATERSEQLNELSVDGLNDLWEAAKTY